MTLFRHVPKVLPANALLHACSLGRWYRACDPDDGDIAWVRLAPGFFVPYFWYEGEEGEEGRKQWYKLDPECTIDRYLEERAKRRFINPCPYGWEGAGSPPQDEDLES